MPRAIPTMVLACVATLPLAPCFAPPAQAQAGSQNDALPSGFRGKITYSGTHQGELRRGRRTQQLGGSLTLELSFDGNRVIARYSGTGGINSGTMTGTRTGSRCRLIDDRGGDVLEAECTRTRFSGVSRQSDSRQSALVRIEGRATHVTDFAAAQPRPAPSNSGSSSTDEQRLAQRTPVFARYTRSQLLRCIAVINYYIVRVEDVGGASAALPGKDDLTVDMIIYIVRRWGGSSESVSKEAGNIVTERNYFDNPANAQADLAQCRNLEALVTGSQPFPARL